LGDYIVEQLKLNTLKPDLEGWRKMTRRMRAAKDPVRVGVVGKYIELHDAYMSVKEALFHAASALDHKLEIVWIDSGDLEKDKSWDAVESLHGIVVPGGFGYRGVEGMVLAGRYARLNKVPYLGLCLGMQTMCIEFARDVLGLEDANSGEFETESENLVIDMMLEQRSITDMGGTMRLGLYPCELQEGSVARRAYGDVPEISERHRHRFEFNNTYREAFRENGMRFSGLSPNGQLVEISEIIDHPFMLGTQFHPEFLSRPNAPHPLFSAFIQASLQPPLQKAVALNSHSAEKKDE
jgi:CTP synthase